MESTIFYILSAVTIGSGILFMTSRKIVHSVFYCFILFITLAGIFLLLDAPFIAAAQVFIYGGAITVLILFVVMVTITDVHGKLRQHQSAIGLVLVAVLFSFMVFGILATKWPIAKNVVRSSGSALSSVTNQLAEQLFKAYYFPFEVAGLLLLAALVGAIYLAREKE